MRSYDFSFLTSNQRGVALLIVMGVVALMTYVIADFSFETHVNKLRVYNITDQQQARLTAEAGLNIAMAKMKIYQKARNMIAQNEALKDQFDLSVLEKAVTSPDLMMPIPSSLGGDLGQQAKNAIEKFNQESLLEGRLSLTISPVKGFLNPNHMRVSASINQEKEEEQEDNQNSEGRTRRRGQREEDDVAPYVYIERKLTETLKEEMREKREESDRFNALYGNTRASLLIKELKYYITHPDNFDEPERSEIESRYVSSDVTPKHAPLTSLDEMYLLEGWDDELINLIKDQLTVHESSVIQVNEITEKQLEVLFPRITDFQIEEFFEYRDGDPEKQLKPHEFKSAEDFKSVIVKRLGIISASNYEERMKKFEAAGMRIGVAGKLFKVESQAKYNRSTYTITAYIGIPIKPKPPKPKKNENEGDDASDSSENQNGQDTQDNPNVTQGQEEEGDGGPEDEQEKKTEFLPPRVVELRRS